MADGIVCRLARLQGRQGSMCSRRIATGVKPYSMQKAGAPGGIRLWRPFQRTGHHQRRKCRMRQRSPASKHLRGKAAQRLLGGLLVSPNYSVTKKTERGEAVFVPGVQQLKVVLVDIADFDSDIDLSGLDASASDKADLQRRLAVEQQKAQFTAQVHTFMDVCLDKCMGRPSNKLDSRTESCLVNCVDQFIDTTLSITNCFAQIVQKGTQ
ncbi:uncharacterized protein [Aquarana catesbeiana]|uniref:uncharacterized protein n=1 Tax=Aquarana catesbeiana TaxID=8400 RepID=UPI003CC9E4CC